MYINKISTNSDVFKFIIIMSIANCVSKFIMSSYSQFSLNKKTGIIEPLENGGRNTIEKNSALHRQQFQQYGRTTIR